MSDSLLQDLDEGVLRLTFNRPRKKNAMDGKLLSAISEALDAARQNDCVSVVLLSGAGGNFSSGMDLTASFDRSGAEPFKDYATALIAFDKPLIAAVDGVAIGGGATVSFHCDIVYVSRSLRMRLPFVSLGLVPEFASSYMLQANIGARRAAELMYTAEWIDADRAYETGIATRIYDDSELHERALEKAREIAQWPVNSLRETKRTLRRVHQTGIQNALEAESQGMLRQTGSPENLEAVKAFIEKRPPNFRALVEGGD